MRTMLKSLLFQKFMVLAFAIPVFSNCSNNNSQNLHQTSTPIALNEHHDTLKFSSGIRSILQDRSGNYWFGSDKEGVCKFDGKRYTYYTTENGLCGNQVIYLLEDETGLIWLGTTHGLCYFNGFTFVAVNEENHVKSTFESQSKSYSNNWLPGNNRQELLRIANGKSYSIPYPFEMPPKANPIDYDITAFSPSKKGGLWIAHYSCVSYFDGKTIQYINNSTMQYDGKSKYMHVRSILEDSKGRLWIGNNGIGVELFEKDTVIHFSEKHGLVKGEPFKYPASPNTLMHVFAIYEDAKGNIWFGDRDTGAWRFDGKEIKNFILDSSLNTQHIWSIYEDKSGNLLFASGDRGVYKFNGNGFDRMF